MELQVKQVPYGVADFAMVIEQNLYYVALLSRLEIIGPEKAWI